MVPSIAFGGELDRLPNGKLDRRALSKWTPVAEAMRSITAPRTPLEELLAGLFAEALGVERIGVEDSFFESGGHSLAAMRLVARVREALGVELPLHRLFETPTVAALVRGIEGSARSEAPSLVRVPRDLPLPLSFAQARLWFLYQLEPASAAYNVPAAVHLRGRLDRAVMAASLGEVARRHESLRTRFVAELQVVDPPSTVALPEIDLASLPVERGLREARRLAREEALRPFDLTAGPLLRSALVSLGAEEQVLLLTMHHVVSDGWSLRLLAGELGEIYGAGAQGRPSPLPELEVQYGDYAVWQRRWLRGEVLAAELAHWRSRLAGAPPVLDLPLDRPRTAVMSERGDSRSLEVSPAFLSSLQALARRQGVTLFMAVLAAFQALLSRVSNAEDVSVGTPVAGRGQLQTEGLIGFFVNTLVMRTDLSGAPSFAALLGRVRETALAAYAHQDLPFEKLVEELQPRRDLSVSPLFQVLVRPGFRGAAGAAAGRSGGGPLAPGAGDREVRSEPHPGSEGRGSLGDPGLPHRSVRRGDDRAAGGPLRASAGGGGGGPSPAGDGAASAVRDRAPSGFGGVERDPPAGGGDPRPRAVRAVGAGGPGS